MKQTQKRTGLLFLYGAGLSKWIWTDMERLSDGETLFAEYPGRQGIPDTTAGLSLQDYTNFVFSQISEWKVDQIVIVVHSIGGVIGLELAARLRDRIVGFVGVGATIPESGGSFLSTLPPLVRYPSLLLMKLAGTRPPDSVIKKGLCNGLSPGDAERVIESFVPESIEIYRQRIEATLPEGFRAYVRLRDDRQMDLKTQERMIRNLRPDRIVDLHTGHLPMLADPEGLIHILSDLMRQINES